MSAQVERFHFPLDVLPTDPAERPRVLLQLLLERLEKNVGRAADQGVVLLLDAVELRDMLRTAVADGQRYVLDDAQLVDLVSRATRVSAGTSLRVSSSGMGWVVEQSSGDVKSPG